MEHTPAAIEARRRALMTSRDRAYAAKDWTTVNEITKRLAKLPVKGDKDYPRAAAPETYKARYMRTTGWIANHVAQDLMLMHGRDAEVSAYDEQRIREAEARDAAIATMPRETRLFSHGS